LTSNDLKVYEGKVMIERIGHLSRLKISHNDLFVSCELDVIDPVKINKFFIVARHGKFAISFDIKKDEIEAILAFMNRTGEVKLE